MRDELRSVLSLESFSDRTFLLSTVASVGTLILNTALEPWKDSSGRQDSRGESRHGSCLDFQQWMICVGTALSVLLLSEARKFVLRQQRTTTAQAAQVR